MDVFLKKMRNIKIEDAICVKITIYKDYHADEVIYYRNNGIVKYFSLDSTISRKITIFATSIR